MSRNSLSVQLSSRPDLYNIDWEYAENLQFLLENGSSSGLVRSKVSTTANTRKYDSGSEMDSVISTVTSKENVPLQPIETTTSVTILKQASTTEKSLNGKAAASPKKETVMGENANYCRIRTIDSVSEEKSAALSPIAVVVNGIESETVRTFHTNFFSANKDRPREVLVSNRAVKVATPLFRSKSVGRRVLSARIQALLENFESSSHQFESSPLQETPRNTEKRTCKQFSPDVSVSGNKSTAEACFVCNEVIYPVDRFSIGSHVYHRGCLRCSVCNCRLSVNSCEAAKDELFCRPHFLERSHGICWNASIKNSCLMRGRPAALQVYECLHADLN